MINNNTDSGTATDTAAQPAAGTSTGTLEDRTIDTQTDEQAGISPVTLSDAAATKLRMVMTEKGIEEPILRVFVSGGGCSGMQYGMGFETNIEESDQVFEEGGMRLVVDPISMGYMDGAHVDYIDDLMGGGFKIENPNAAKSCGCGQSFKPAEGSARDAPEPPPGMSCGGCG